MGNNPLLSFLQNSDNSEYIEIFNFKFYFDDLLIICLLFFLYKEEDTSAKIALKILDILYVV